MRSCLFCGQKANSKEHVWPDWILEQLKTQRKIAIAGDIDGRKLRMAGFKPELKAKFVCKSCNTGWMSNLEHANSRIIGPMLHDISIPLDPTQQWSIARWALKSSMVVEGIANQKQAFYHQNEREDLRHSIVPQNTFIWLGRYVGNHEISVAAMHLWSDIPGDPKVFHCYVTTVVFGYFVFQVFSAHVPYGHPRVGLNTVPGPWNDVLISIWPANKTTIVWPSPLCFDDFSFGISDLINRFRPELAQEVP